MPDSKHQRPVFLCDEFEFAAVLSHISEFLLQHTVLDDEFRKRTFRVGERILQQDHALY
jgi:hypothetical protein